MQYRIIYVPAIQIYNIVCHYVVKNNNKRQFPQNEKLALQKLATIYNYTQKRQK